MMQKTISIKTQRILSVIPFINTVVLFIWIHNYRVAVRDSKVFAKSLAVLFATTIPLACLQAFLQTALEGYHTAVIIIDYLAIYVIPLCMSIGLIRFQKKVLGE